MKAPNTTTLPRVSVPMPTPSWLQNYSPLLQQARIFSNQDREQEALDLALAAYQETPSLDALEQAFDSYLSLKQPENAKKLLKDMKKLGASETFLNLQRATYYTVLENFKSAKRYLDKVSAHQKELDTRHRCYFYFAQGLLSFTTDHPQTFPFTQALRHDYLLMPSELSMIYEIRGIIRLEQEAYEAAYQDAQSALHAYVPQNNDSVYYVRALSGYYAGHCSHITEDINRCLESRDPQITKNMKNILRKLRKLLPNGPVIIDEDFSAKLRHCFFDDAEDLINIAEDLEECLKTWTGKRFEGLMAQSIGKGIGFLKESFSKLEEPDLPQTLDTGAQNLQRYAQTHFLPACLALEKQETHGADTTVSQLREWKKQVTEVFDRYDNVYGKLIEELDKLLKIYPIPVFLADKKK